MTAAFTIDARQVDAEARRWSLATVTLGARAFRLVERHGQLLLGRVKARASLPRTAGRAGDVTRAARSRQAAPFMGARQFGALLATSDVWSGVRLITGGYNRSLNMRMSLSATGPVAAVGTNDQRGRRLEFGFSGVDSRGRRYAQPPYPHFGPAVDETTPGFVQDAADLLPEVLGR